jgi:hypothetical protein
MANQENYVEVIPRNPQSFSVSRIAESETDIDIIEGRLPAEFGFDVDDNVEMHFYDSVNRLVGSVIIPVNTGILSSRTVILPDGSKDEKIIVDMTRVQKELGLIIPPGTYTTTINLFSDEIGTYTDRKLTIEEVAPSRTELRLGFNTTFTDVEQSELFEFIEPGVPRVLAAGLVGGTVGVGQGDTITQTETGEQQVQEFISMINDSLLNFNPELQAQLINLEADLPDNLNLTIEFISAAIYDEFVNLVELTKNTKQFDRFQESEIRALIEKAIDNALVNNNINLFTQNQIRYI